MLDALKQDVSSAICYLVSRSLRPMGQGSVTVFDRANNLIVAEPMESPANAEPGNMLVVDLSGNVIEGDGTPCRALPAHIELYRSFPQINSIVHSHGLYTTAWAQAGRNIPVYGTGHLEFCKDAVPCTRAITIDDAEKGYHNAMALCVFEMFQKNALDPTAVPAALVFQHGAFAWGADAGTAAKNAALLEHIAKLAWMTETINPSIVDTRNNITPRT